MTTQVVKAVSATGMVGTGFKEASLRTASEGASFIASDGGSTDPGPYYLGSGLSQPSDAAIERDLALILEIGLDRGIPVILGSAGTAGGRPHVARVRGIIERIAQQRGLHFTLATLETEMQPETVVRALQAGRLRPLPNAPEVTPQSIMATTRIVAMAGPEPFQHALREGAQVVLAGRSSDTSLFVAVPAMQGIPMGVCYHAAKVLECGAASVVQRLYPDSMMATLDVEGFTIEPPNPAMRCTPQSVASHTLYENGDPFLLVEPGGTLDTSQARYKAVSDRAVRVTGSGFIEAEAYTVRLEAASLRGYRSAVVAGIRDPLVIRQLGSFIESANASIHDKVRESLKLADEQYVIRWQVYGRDGSMGELEPDRDVQGHEVGTVIDVVGPTQNAANAIASVAWHTALHHPIPEYHGLVSNLAFPFSPPSLVGGPVYEFSMNHAMVLERPEDAYELSISEVGSRVPSFR